MLTIGQLKAVAGTAESKGFTVQTPTARIIDVGTEFGAAVSADGHSHVDVIRGEVDVQMNGVPLQRLRQGEALTIEPGSPQVIVRIESGDESPRFQFPTIEPPSDQDYADRSKGKATARVVSGTVSKQSGPVEVLFDGRGQSRADAPAESFFFDDEKPGLVLLDLGQVVSVRKINAYSWHVHGGLAWDHVRATQKYYLYGFAGDKPPSTETPLTKHGWEAIARVNTDEFFNVTEPILRPSQQATSVTAVRGPIGRYRYLLWDVRPTRADKGPATAHTFFGEIDVYADP